MKGTKQIARGTGKVMLALLGGILMPILIWVAFGVAISQKARERIPQRKPAPTIGEILAATGLTIEGETAAGKPVAARVFRAQSASQINKILAKAGLSLHDTSKIAQPEPRLSEFKPAPRRA